MGTSTIMRLLLYNIVGDRDCLSSNSVPADRNISALAIFSLFRPRFSAHG